jgi:MFS family permease
MLFIGAGLMGTGFLLALYLQQVLHFSAVKTGFAFLPFSAGIIVSQGVSPKLVAKLAPRLVAAPGLLLAAAAMFWLSLLGADSSYLAHVLPAVFLTAFGLGLAFVPLTVTILQGVPGGETGVASALFNTSQQIGAALGVAVFGSIANAATDVQMPAAAEALTRGVATDDPGLAAQASEALAHGYTVALLAAAVMLVVAALVVATAVDARRPQQIDTEQPDATAPTTAREEAATLSQPTARVQ